MLFALHSLMKVELAWDLAQLLVLEADDVRPVHRRAARDAPSPASDRKLDRAGLDEDVVAR